jgi:hypothetical protein
MNKSITHNIILLGALAVLFVGANSAHAYVPGVWEPQTTRVTTPSNQSAWTTPVPSGPNTSPTPAITKPETIKTTTTTTTTVIQPVKPLPKETTVIQTNTQPTVTNLPPVMTSQPTQENNLTALSVRGSGGFMPSSVWQWFLVILLILAIVIIARAMTRGSHDAHAVHAH